MIRKALKIGVLLVGVGLAFGLGRAQPAKASLGGGYYDPPLSTPNPHPPTCSRCVGNQCSYGYTSGANSCTYKCTVSYIYVIQTGVLDWYGNPIGGFKGEWVSVVHCDCEEVGYCG